MKEKGFTLLETLIAVTILSVSLAGPITIASQGLSSAFFAKEQITAFYLAQEAVEYVRSVRDENFLSGNNWLEGISDCVGAVCEIDMPAHTHEVCSSGSCDALNFNTDTALYNNNALGGDNIASIYTREVTLEQINADEVSINVNLTWSSKGRTRTFNIRENIYNWLP